MCCPALLQPDLAPSYPTEPSIRIRKCLTLYKRGHFAWLLWLVSLDRARGKEALNNTERENKRWRDLWPIWSPPPQTCTLHSTEHMKEKTLDLSNDCFMRITLTELFNKNVFYSTDPHTSQAASFLLWNKLQLCLVLTGKCEIWKNVYFPSFLQCSTSCVIVETSWLPPSCTHTALFPSSPWPGQHVSVSGHFPKALLSAMWPWLVRVYTGSSNVDKRLWINRLTNTTR